MGEAPAKNPRAAKGQGVKKPAAKTRGPTAEDVDAVWDALSGGRSQLQAADLQHAAHRHGLKSLSLEDAHAMLAHFTASGKLKKEELSKVLAAANARVPL